MTIEPGPCPRIEGAKQLLLEAFNAARDGFALSPGELALIVSCTLRSINQPSANVPLPDTAPELWADRDLNRRENAVTFIRRVYAPWIGKGLTRAMISSLDHDLYRAFTVWLTRHPDDSIAVELPRKSDLTDALIEDLSAVYSIDTLRRLGSTLNARMRRPAPSSKP